MSMLARTALGRTVHLTVHPRPRDIRDSQQLLRVLQSFGEIETFRHLKYESEKPAPNRYLAVYRDRASVSEIVAAGHVEFDYPQQRSSCQILPDARDREAESTDQTTGGDKRVAFLKVEPSYMDHEAYITRQPYYGPYSQTASALYDDLHDRLPRGLYGMAFVDYFKGEVPLRLRLKRFGDKSNGERRHKTLLGLWRQYTAD